MSTKNDAPADKCNPVFDVMDLYLKTGVESVNEHLGLSVQRKSPEYAAAYLQGCAAIHAAELVALSLDRQSAAITKLADAHVCTGQHKPFDGYQGTIMSSRIEALKREIQTAGRVCFELGNGAHEAYQTALGELGNFALHDEGISPEKTKEIWALFELYEAKRDGALDAEIRKAAAIQALFIELHHPIL